MWHRDIKWANIDGKTVPIDLLDVVATNLPCVKKKQYPQSLIK